MAVRVFLIFVTALAYVEFSAASPTRRQYITNTEATASDPPVTNDGAVWDDNDEFDLDGEDWFSQSVVSPSSVPQKAQEYDEYDDDYPPGNVMVKFEDNDEEEDEDERSQEAEEDDGSRNDSEFLFPPPRDTRLLLEDDDDDQSGPIKVRHTGRSSYPRVSEGGDNSIESSEDDKDDAEHPDEFTIDEDDKEDDDEDHDPHKDPDSVEVQSRNELHDDEDDEDEFVSEGDDNDMFDNPEQEAAQVIYGDHVFLY